MKTNRVDWFISSGRVGGLFKYSLRRAFNSPKVVLIFGSISFIFFTGVRVSSGMFDHAQFIVEL
jgi:hypothetical protein